MSEICIDYTRAERTALAIILFSDNITLEQVNSFFYYTNENMFIDMQSKATYNAIKENYERFNDLLGTKHFAYHINLIVALDTGVEGFVSSLEELWMPVATMHNWITRVQETYFKLMYEKASSKADFNKLIAEENRYLITNEMSDISEDGSKALEEYDARKDSAIFTPYKSVNSIVGSLQGGDFIVLAGATGGGKTCTMLNLATGIAKDGYMVDIFSLEMPKYQLQQRIICSETLIDAQKFRSFSLDENERKKFTDYSNNGLKKLGIRIYKKQTVGIEEIRRIELKSKADVVFIDYLGLIDSYGNKSSYEKFSNISRDIKLLAMECNKPIIALHQLNRDFQNREDKRPKTSDLRDSGKIEQDADMIWFVYRPFVFGESIDPEEMLFIVAKNRHGEMNKEAKLRFIGKFQKIVERE